MSLRNPVISLSLGLWAALCGMAQAWGQAVPDPSCKDVLVMKSPNASFSGKVIAWRADSLWFQTWSGPVIGLSTDQIRSLKTRCSCRDYAFRERGWYGATRMALLLGRTSYESAAIGGLIHQSIGWQFSRHLGIGAGLGIASYDAAYEEVVSYPITVELRGFLKAERFSPFYQVAAGWAGVGRQETFPGGGVWRGGPLAMAHIGYRLGNHIALYGGYHFSQKVRTWENVGIGGSRKDRILHRRLELGLSVMY